MRRVLRPSSARKGKMRFVLPSPPASSACCFGGHCASASRLELPTFGAPLWPMCSCPTSAKTAPSQRSSRTVCTSAGFSVWLDRHIHGGVGFRKEIDRQLGAAKVVVVLWSAASLESEWVCDEAQQARDGFKLIPVRLEQRPAAAGFPSGQSLDFGGWSGDPNAAAFVGAGNRAADAIARRIHQANESGGIWITVPTAEIQ